MCNTTRKQLFVRQEEQTKLFVRQEENKSICKTREKLFARLEENKIYL